MSNTFAPSATVPRRSSGSASALALVTRPRARPVPASAPTSPVSVASALLQRIDPPIAPSATAAVAKCSPPPYFLADLEELDGILREFASSATPAQAALRQRALDSRGALARFQRSAADAGRYARLKAFGNAELSLPDGTFEADSRPYATFDEAFDANFPVNR